MIIRSFNQSRVVAGLMALALLAAACAGPGGSPGSSGAASTGASAEPSQSTEPVAVCELAYYTGEFGAFGQSLTEDVVFPIEEVINLDPPLGRT